MIFLHCEKMSEFVSACGLGLNVKLLMYEKQTHNLL